jgi:hypothetical protein
MVSLAETGYFCRKGQGNGAEKASFVVPPPSVRSKSEQWRTRRFPVKQQPTEKKKDPIGRQ